MSTQVTKAHAATANDIYQLAKDAAHKGAPFLGPCAQLIADSEAKAASAIHHELNEARNAERLARVQLATERQKVRALTAILESICEEWGRNHDANPIGAGQRMSTMAGKALEKLEQDEENS